MKITIFLLVLIFYFLSIVLGDWTRNENLLKSIDLSKRELKVGRNFIGDIAIGYFIVDSCTSLPNYNRAKLTKKCWKDDAPVSDVPYICVEGTTNTVYFGNAGSGFVINKEIFIFDDAQWTVGNVPGTPIYSRCNAECQVGYCYESCVATCNAGCTESTSTNWFIVPQSTAAESNEVVHCGGQNFCCSQYLDEDNFDSVNDISTNPTVCPPIDSVDHSITYDFIYGTPNIEYGNEFIALKSGKITHFQIKLRSNINYPSDKPAVFKLWNLNEVLLASKSLTGTLVVGWNYIQLETPVDITQNFNFVVSLNILDTDSISVRYNGAVLLPTSSTYFTVLNFRTSTSGFPQIEQIFPNKIYSSFGVTFVPSTC